MQITVADSEETIEETIYVEIVTDTEDNQPEFTQDTYSFSIREDTADGTEIGDVDATDEGIYIQYNITNQKCIKFCCGFVLTAPPHV